MLPLLHLFRPKGSTHACVNTSRILQSVRRLASIPVIDVSSLVKPAAQQTYGDTDKQIAAGHQLCKAARQIGFFYVENSGISQTLTDDVLNRSKAWFDLPKAIKHEIVLSPERHYRGYQALGSNVNRRERGYNRDQHEALDFYKEVSPDTQPPSPIHGANQWPTHVPGLKPLLQEYVDRMLQLGRGVMSGIALGLGEPERLPGEPRMSEDSYWGMRLIHYPPLIEGDPPAAIYRQACQSNDTTSFASEIIDNLEKRLTEIYWACLALHIMHGRACVYELNMCCVVCITLHVVRHRRHWAGEGHEVAHEASAFYLRFANHKIYILNYSLLYSLGVPDYFIKLAVREAPAIRIVVSR